MRVLSSRLRCLSESCRTNSFLFNANGGQYNLVGQKYRRPHPAFAHSESYDMPLQSHQSLITHLQSQIVDALRYGHRERAQKLLWHVAHRHSFSSSRDLQNVLDYCSKTPDPLFVIELWNFMHEKKVRISKRSSVFLIASLTRGGDLDQALDWLKVLGEMYHSRPPVAMYNAFLHACAKAKSFVHANSCLQLMESRLVGKSEVTYCQLLKLAVSDHNLSAVEKIWKECTRYYNPSIRCIRKFIRSFSTLGDLKSADKALQHLVSLCFSGKSPEGQVYLSSLQIPMHSDPKNLYLFWGNMRPRQESALAPDDPLNISEKKKISSLPAKLILRCSFRDVIEACAELRNRELAWRLFLQMRRLGLRPSSRILNGMLQAVVYGKGTTYVMDHVKEMIEKERGLDNSSRSALAVGYTKELKLDLAEAMLNELNDNSPMDIFPFNIFLAACDREDEPEQAIRIMAKMKNWKIKFDIRTYELMFSLFGNVNPPYEKGNLLSQAAVLKRIQAIEMDMAKNDVPHNLATMENVLTAFATEGMINEMLHYLQVAENHLQRMNQTASTYMYNVLLNALAECKDVKIAKEIFKRMRLFGIECDSVTYGIMTNCCYHIRSYSSAQTLMGIMISDGCPPDVRTYTMLVKICLSRGDFDEAMNLLDRAHAAGVKSNVILFNEIFEMAFFKRRIDVMEFSIHKMRLANIKPDTNTIHFVFDTYLNCGFEATALEALQVLCVRMISRDESVPRELQAAYEDIILSEDDDADNRIIEMFNNKKDVVAVALVCLRWCAMLGDSLSWSPDESPWVKEVADTYNSVMGIHRLTSS